MAARIGLLLIILFVTPPVCARTLTCLPPRCSCMQSARPSFSRLPLLPSSAPLLRSCPASTAVLSVCEMGADASRPVAPPKSKSFGEPTYTVDKFLRQVRSGRFTLENDMLLNNLISRRWCPFLGYGKTAGDGAVPHVDALLRSELPTDQPHQEKMRKLLHDNQMLFEWLSDPALYEAATNHAIANAWLSLFCRYMDPSSPPAAAPPLALNFSPRVLAILLTVWSDFKEVSGRGRNKSAPVDPSTPQGRARRDLDIIMRAHGMTPEEPEILSDRWRAELAFGPH